MKGISVIICCYNSAKKLIPTLKYLADQELRQDANFEIILIDNNCTDSTTSLALETWKSLNAPFPLTITKQTKAGLSYAREKGIKQAIYDYIILCDDDNWLCKNYLKRVFDLFEKMPEVALIGGVGEAVFEKQAPEWFTELKGFGYAIGTEGRQTGYVHSVYGAGMCIRKAAFLAAISNGFSFFLTDRKGYNLSSGGDTEMSIIINNAGYKIYLDTALTFKHFLSADRLEWSYYLKLRKAFGKANAYLHSYIPLAIIEDSCLTEKGFLSLLSFSKFTILNIKYILFPSFFKNESCANFSQIWRMRFTCLVDKEIIAKRRMSIFQILMVDKQGLTTVNRYQ